MCITTNRFLITFMFVGSLACLCASVSADVIHYGQADRDAWFSELPTAQAITFQEHPQEFPTVTLDRKFYEESHGVVFSDLTGAGVLQVEQGSGWQLDGVGLSVAGPLGSLILSFSEPMTAFAGAFNGVLIGYEIYSKGLMIESGEWQLFQWENNFRGFISDTPFDQVRLTGHSSTLLADDFYFAAVPAPAAWVLVVAGGLSGMRRRRC